MKTSEFSECKEAGEKRAWRPGRKQRLYKTEVRRYGDHGGGEVPGVREGLS
jgi:hypothetical protein